MLQYRVGCAADAVLPVPALLSREVPEAAAGPAPVPAESAAAGRATVHQASAHSVGPVVDTLRGVNITWCGEVQFKQKVPPSLASPFPLPCWILTQKQKVNSPLIGLCWLF